MTQFHTEDRKTEVEKQGEILAGSGTFSLGTVFRPFLLSGKVTDTLQIYPTKSFGILRFLEWGVRHLSQQRKIDHYPLSC